MKILADSWEAVTKEIVIICFKKAGINPDIQQAAIADLDNESKDIHQNLYKLKSANPSTVPEDVTADSIVSLDDDAIATAPEIVESDIIEKLCIYQQTEVEAEETTKIQSRNRLFKAGKIPQDQELNLPFNLPLKRLPRTVIKEMKCYVLSSNSKSCIALND